MRDDESWLQSTGKPLCLGLSVRINDHSPYWRDYEGIEMRITGMRFEKCGQKVNITLGENLSDQDSDGWTISELTPIT